MKDYHARLIALAIMCSGLMVSGHFYVGIASYAFFNLIESVFLKDK